MPKDEFLFLSYSHADPGAHALVPFLETLGHRIWIDERNLRHGNVIDLEAQAAIDQSAGFVAVLTPSYIDPTRYPYAEFHYAKFTARKPIAPLLFEPIDPNRLPIAMAGILVRQSALRLLSPEEQPMEIARTLMDVNIAIPSKFVPDAPPSQDLLVGAIFPSFSELKRSDRSSLAAILRRLHGISQTSGDNGFANLNIALINLYLGSNTEAERYVKLAMERLPHSSEASFFHCLVLMAGRRLAATSTQIVSELQQSLQRAGELGHDPSLVGLVAAAIAHEHYTLNGLPLRGNSVNSTIGQVDLRQVDQDELDRTLSVLVHSTPNFVRRYIKSE